MHKLSEGMAAAVATGTGGIAFGTWLATATVAVQLVAATVAVGVGVVSLLYYFERWRKLRNERRNTRTS